MATKNFTYSDYLHLDVEISQAKYQVTVDEAPYYRWKEEKEKAEKLLPYLKFKPRYPFHKADVEWMRGDCITELMIVPAKVFGAIHNFFYLIFFVVFYPFVAIYRRITIPGDIRRATKHLQKAEEKFRKSQAELEKWKKKKAYVDRYYPAFHDRSVRENAAERKAKEHEQILNNPYTRKVYKDTYRELTGTMSAEEIHDREIEAIVLEIEEDLMDSDFLKD